MKYVKPPTVRDLDRQLVINMLIEHRCIIYKAADALGVPSHDLRRLVYREPELMFVAREAKEQLCDRAEEIVYEALYDGDDAQRRDVMARFVLQSELARNRGFSPRAMRPKFVQQSAVIVGWATDDDSTANDAMALGHAARR
jgi:hypothetical protein